ncbi:NAD(P)H-dependent oxidoreductase [Pseudomonas aeruginosa]|nr:NAD(P)H-dependent oxidoreductase [Pseudomonas aeruginosa]
MAHTKRVAQAAAEGAQASLIEIDSEGNIPEAAWDLLDQAQSILFGAPTYMGSVPRQFKKFADATSRSGLFGSGRTRSSAASPTAQA